MVTVCIPVLNRYDLLPAVLDSCERGMLVPDQYMILDNGGRLNDQFLENLPVKDKDKIKALRPLQGNVGVAASWNYFIDNTKEERIIINDDILMHENTIEMLVNTPGPMVTCSGSTNAFSIFLLRDSCVEKVGKFDETISPGYAYFEDNDYHYRMQLLGLNFVDCGASCTHLHGGSSTIKRYSQSELLAHHMKFQYAEKNYIRKWGGPVGKETFTTPYGK